MEVTATNLGFEFEKTREREKNQQNNSEPKKYGLNWNVEIEYKSMLYKSTLTEHTSYTMMKWW